MGAWWLGYLIAGVITLASAVPFWFLPRALAPPQERALDDESPLERASFLKDSGPAIKHKYMPEELANFHDMAKGTAAAWESWFDCIGQSVL